MKRFIALSLSACIVFTACKPDELEKAEHDAAVQQAINDDVRVERSAEEQRLMDDELAKKNRT
ncbi:MAG: hypothetical protein WAN92_03850 [Herbaspirillum sp.]